MNPGSFRPASLIAEFMRVLALASLLLAPAPFAHAHEGDSPDVPKVGDHLRLSLHTGPPPLSGRLLGYDETSLRILLDGRAYPDTTIQVIPRASIEALEVDTSHGHPGKGALIGLIAGLVITGIVVAGAASDLDSPDAAEALLPPVVGMGLGALIGSSGRHGGWRPARQP